MYRAIIATIAVCAIVATAAVIGVATHFQGQIDEAEAEANELRSQLSKTAKGETRSNDSGALAAIAEENGELILKVKELEEKLASVKSELSKANEALMAQSTPEPELDTGEVLDSLADVFDETREEAMREDFRERRAEFAAIAQDRMNTMMDEAIANAKSPEEKERFGAMQEHMNHLTTLYGEMRMVETDEEREAYREAIDQTRDTLRDLGREQQESQLRAVAEQFKIPEEQQTAFFQALDQARENPMFRSPFVSGGGRGSGPPGGRRGGWGGDRGGGRDQ